MLAFTTGLTETSGRLMGLHDRQVRPKGGVASSLETSQMGDGGFLGRPDAQHVGFAIRPHSLDTIGPALGG